MPPSHSQADSFWPFFPFVFVGIWLFVSFVIAHLGWRSFSAQYPAPTKPPGRVYTSSSSWFGNFMATYRNVVRVVMTEEGIYFYTMFLFRAFHPPFLLPWSSVRRVEKQQYTFWQCYRLEIKDAAGEIHLTLPKKVEEDLLKYHKAV